MRCSPSKLTGEYTLAKKQTFLIVDTETTKNDHVADFGALICDRHGNVLTSCAILVSDFFLTEELFYNPDDTGFWGKMAAIQRKEKYHGMLGAGSRMMASANAINRWLEKAKATYNPTLTAYNLPFDETKCRNSGIDLGIFENRFCLWAAAVGNICNTKKYLQFVLENHLFTAPTDLGNMSVKTSAESVAGFLFGEFREEPHTAIEDARDFELPILKHIVSKRGWKEKMTPYSWRAFQVKDHFRTK